MNNSKTAVKKETAKMEKVQEVKTAQVEKSTAKVDEILNPSADARIKKLETFNRLAEKKAKIDTKLNELVNYNASNDNSNSKLDFSANNGYHFIISNPETIKKLLSFVHEELVQLKETTEQEIITFSI